LFFCSPAHPLTRSPAHPLTRSPAHSLTRSHAHTLTHSHARTLTRSHGSRSHAHTLYTLTRSHVHTFTHVHTVHTVHTFARLCECAHVISGVHSLRDISHRTLTRNMVNRNRDTFTERQNAPTSRRERFSKCSLNPIRIQCGGFTHWSSRKPARWLH
jgi:hypothetical protein